MDEAQAIMLQHKKEKQKIIELTHEEFDTLTVFLRSLTQFNRNPNNGRPWSLNYSGVESVIRFMNVDFTTEMFGFLQIIEREAIKVLNKDDD